MELTLKEIQTVLARLINHYPEAGHNGVTISRLAADWLAILKEEEVTSAQFSKGIRWCIKNCHFFPKLADVMQGVREYRSSANIATAGRIGALAIPESTTDGKNWTEEEVSRNKAMISMILKAATKQVSVEEAVEYVEKMVGKSN